MTLRRAIIAILAGTMLPTLGATQTLQLADLTNAEYWLGVLVLGVTSFSASTTTVITALVRDLGLETK